MKQFREWMQRYGHWLLIAAVLVFSLWLRYDYIVDIEVKPVSDMEDYDQRALRLVNEGTFQTGELHGATYRPPGYVVFLAAIYGLIDHKYRLVYAIQSVLSVATLYAIYWIGQQLWNRWVGVTALVLSALYVPFIGYSGVLLSETLFNFLFLYALAAFLRGVQTESGWWYAAAGVLFGLSTLTRSIALVVPPILVVWLLLEKKVWPWKYGKEAWIRFVLLFAAMAVVIAPWTIRNYAEQKSFVLVDTISGLNLLIGNNEYADGFYRDTLFSTKGFKRAFREGQTDAERDQIMKDEAKKWIAAHPGRFAELTWDRFQMYLAAQKDWVDDLYKFENIELLEDDKREAAFSEWFQRYATALALVTVVASFVRAVVRRDMRALLPTFIAGYFIAALSVFYVQMRYKFPAMPFVMLLCAFALWQMRSNWKALVLMAPATYAVAQWLLDLAVKYDV